MVFYVVDGDGAQRCGPYTDKRAAESARSILAWEKPQETFVVEERPA